MTPANDLALLREFIRGQSQDAFTALVQRHLGLVYCAALRQVRSPQLAEEIAQSVFTDLARNAARLKPDTILTAWLYEVTRRTAINVVRGEARRQLREQIALEMNAMNATTDDWRQIEPLLDDAMHALDDIDRTAILLRFFENKSLREVGESLGTTDDTARKRVNRAVERLREFFAKHGVNAGASGLVALISGNAIQAAPVGLAVTISTGAFLAGTTLTTTAVATATKAIAMTTLQKTLIGAALAAAVATGIYEARQAALLRAELHQRRQRETEKSELQRERDEALARAAALANENDGLKNASTDLVKLRAEVTRLRAAEQDLARLRAAGPHLEKPATEPPVQANETDLGKDSWGDVGFATPQATLRTRGWSVLNTNLERFAESVLITERARKAFEDALTRMVQGSQHPEQAKIVMLEALEKKFPIEEGLLTRLLGENIGGGYTGYRILSQQSPSAEDTVLEVETQMESRSPRKELLTFRRVGTEWKIVIDKVPPR